MGVRFYMEIKAENSMRWGVTSLPVTSGGVYKHFGGKASDNLGVDPVEH